MSFAIYGESDTYVHLVAAENYDDVIALFLADVESVGVKLKNVTNVYAVFHNQEEPNLERQVKQLIEEAVCK